MTKDPTTCEHRQINRIFNTWRCNECGAEFRPVDPKHITPWEPWRS